MKNYFKIYLQNKPPFLALIRGKEAELFQQYIPLKKPVLDFGSGDGFFASVITNGDQKIEVGIDIDKKENIKARNIKIYQKVQLIKNNAIPYKNNYFETVISNCVLEHVDELDENLHEINRVLKKNGLFICTVMASPWEGYLFGTKLLGSYYKTWMRNKQRHVQLPSCLEWKKIFNRNGFSVIKTVGYLDPKASTLLDILHYVSTYTLITKSLFDRWVLFPQVYNYIPVDRMLKRVADRKVSVNKSSALFFVLRK